MTKGTQPRWQELNCTRTPLTSWRVKALRLSWGLREYARCQSDAGVPPVVVWQLADAKDVSSSSDSDKTGHLRSKQAVIVCQKRRRCNWQSVSLRDLVRFSGELTAFHGDRRWIPPYALIRHEQHKHGVPALFGLDDRRGFA